MGFSLPLSHSPSLHLYASVSLTQPSIFTLDVIFSLACIVTQSQNELKMGICNYYKQGKFNWNLESRAAR